MTPRKPNQPTLTRDRIVASAIAIVDRDGLDALSMRRLAAELGVGPMSLYYHVPDKSALYDLILDAVLSSADLSADDPTASVEARMKAVGWALRRALLAHPGVAVIAASRSMRTAAQLRPVEAMLQMLAEAGLSEVDAMQAVNAIGQYAVGVTTMYANHLGDVEYHDDVRESDFGSITPEEFPRVTQALSHAEHFGSWDSDFEAGISALIKGLVLDRLRQ